MHLQEAQARRTTADAAHDSACLSKARSHPTSLFEQSMMKTQKKNKQTKANTLTFVELTHAQRSPVAPYRPTRRHCTMQPTTKHDSVSHVYSHLRIAPTKSPRHASAVGASGSGVDATSTNLPLVSHFTRRKTSAPEESPPEFCVSSRCNRSYSYRLRRSLARCCVRCSTARRSLTSCRRRRR